MNKANGIYLTLSDCRNSNEEEQYNKWYDNVLIPKIKELNFIENVKRFQNVLADSPLFAGRPKYLTLYEVNSDDLFQAFQSIRKKINELIHNDIGFKCHTPVFDTLYRRISSTYERENADNVLKGVYVVLNYCTDPAREEEYNKWYTDKHLPETVNLGFLDRATRYKIVDPTKPTFHQPPYLTIYEISMDPLDARNNLVNNRWRWEGDKLWTDLLGLNFTGGFKLL